MNQHLEDILKLIQQSEKLTAEEKKEGAQALRIAEEELQLKNHDLQIEASLERVRAVALNLKQPHDVLSVCKVMFHELQSLGFTDLRNALINFWDDEDGSLLDYDYSDYAGGHFVQIPYNTHPAFEKFQERIRSSTDAFAELKVSEDELESWKQRRRKDGEYEDPRLDKISALYYYFYSTGVGALGISTFKSLSAENLNVLKRFRNVFDLAYRRYMDVALAEAQAREARIEVALERVRSKAMAMHKSDDLNSAVATVFEELDKLNLGVQRCGIGILNKETFKVDVWTTTVSDHGKTVQVSGDESMDIHPLLHGAYDAWLRQEDFSYVLKGEDLLEYYRALAKTNFILPDSVQVTSGKEGQQQYYFNAMFQAGGLFAFRETEFPEEAKLVMKRFASVFNLTYKRFLDLQKAEAQTRESQIQLALERVRARTMAMQKSDELAETSFVLFQQFKELGEVAEQLTIGILNQDESMMDLYATLHGTQWNAAARVEMKEPIVMKKIYSAWKEQKKSLVIDLTGNDLIEYNKFRAARGSSQFVWKEEYASDRWVIHAAFFSRGILSFSFLENRPQETVQLLERFAGVFDLTYTRFLDLKKAEAQAREAQIELALERVRARTMAMQHSTELAEAAEVLFQQVQALGIKTRSCGYNIWDEKQNNTTVWTSAPEGGIQPPFDLPHNKIAVYKNLHAAMERGEGFFVEEVGGDALKKHFEYLLELPGIGDIIRGYEKIGIVPPNFMVFHAVFFQQGYLSFHTLEPVPEAWDIFKRFAKVFEQTYTRFLDLQKAEAQAREAQIEAALERVRSRTMGMQKSEELKEVIQVVYQQFAHLNINIGHTGFVMDYKARDDYAIWIADPLGVPSQVIIPYFDSVYYNRFNEAKEKGEDFFATNLTFEEKNKFYQKLFEYVPGLPEESKQFYFSCLGLAISTVLLENIGLYIENFEGIPYSDEDNNTLMRFGKVFQQTYTRFLDLQKAEEQIREAKIEAALERTRTQSMIMQHSKELDDTLRVFHEQVLLLGIHSAFSFLWLPDEEKDRHIFWAAWAENLPTGHFEKNDSTVFKSKAINYPLDRNEPATAQCLVDWKGNDPIVSYHVPPSGVENYFAAWQELIAGVEQLKPECFAGGLYYVEAFMKYGCFGVMIKNDLQEEEKKTLYRFSIEFERAYTRFLDLQKAEAQAREALIEVSLERVRSKAMAMHSSSHLTEAAGALFTELNKLGINPIRTGFVLLTKESRRAKLYPATSLDKENTVSYTGEFEFIGHPVYEKQYENWQRKENYFPVLEGEILKSYYTILSEALSVSFDQFKETDKQFGCFLPFSEGFLFTWSVEPYSKEEISILERFKSILDLTIRRYLDLQKAEAQTREAQIEASLERVRAGAMAMHSSEDLAATVNVFFKELKTLGIVPIRVGVAQLDAKEQTSAMTATTALHQGDSHEVIGKIKLLGHPVLENIFHHWQLQQEYFPVLTGKELKEYYAAMKPQVVYPEYPDDAMQHGSYFSFKEGTVFTWTEKELTEEQLRIFRRFTSVISLTYRRYIDLKEAEAQAREAQIEAGLERVRSRTLAMHSSDELAETAAVVFKQLIILGIEPNRLYIAIIKDEDGSVEFWITDEDGSKVSSGFTANLNDNPTFLKMFAGWKEQKKSITIDMQGEELQEYFRHLSELHVPFKGGLAQTRRVQNIAYFSQGFIGIASPDSQPEETDRLLERFASVFNLTYARFNDLQIAEAQAHQAQIEAAMERVRGRALAMQQPEELLDVAEVLRHEMGVLGLEEFETGAVFIFDEVSETAQFGFTAKNPAQPEKGTVTDTVTLDLNQTQSGRKFLKFLKSDEIQTSIRMEGVERKEWIENLYTLSSKANNFFGDNIRDRTYHFYKFSNGAVTAISNDDITEDSWDLLKRAASVFTLAYSRFKDLTKARIDLINLKEEKKRSDSLLLNILPQEIADELKQFGKSYARKHDEVTILFADIKGFSTIAETLSATELVNQLDECFRAFDHIVDKHGLEKIKTVGDAYVCACGLPKPVVDNAAKAVRAALDMINFIKGFALTKTIQDLPAFEFRIGIHTGPVITGVVGLKKFTYDIWGDAVNMAARMEQHGEEGKINISGSTYALVKDKFTCTPRGKIPAKNKGEVEMYFVES